jgi:hypothetical protein
MSKQNLTTLRCVAALNTLELVLWSHPVTLLNHQRATYRHIFAVNLYEVIYAS